MLPNDPQPTPTVGAPPEVSPNPLVTVPLDDEALTKWKGEIDRSKKRRDIYSPGWEKNLSDYAPAPNNDAWGSEVNPGIVFYTVEQKKALLFFDTPTVILTAKPGVDPAAVQQQQQRLNNRLGDEGIDASRLMDQVLFDILCPSGEGCIKVGYTNVSKPTPIQAPQGYVPLGQPPPPPQTQIAQVPIFQEVFAEHFSPKKLLKPTNFPSTEFDKGPWLGMAFSMPRRQAIRQFNLPEDFDRKGDAKDQTFEHPGVPKDDVDDDIVTGVSLEYKAALYDDAELHPLKLRELVLIDGFDDGPVVHRDSPHQTFDARGQLTPDSLIGFSICVLTIRDLSDSAFVPSDATMIRPLVREVATFRQQIIDARDSGTSIRLADEKIITPEVMAKVIRGPFGLIVPIADYNPNQPPITEVAKATLGRESFQAQAVLDNDLAKMTTISANQAGNTENNVHSATEIQTIAQNAQVRMQKERTRVIKGFLGFVRKFDAFIRRYPEMGAPQLQLGKYSYDIKPDSGVHMDAATDRKFAMDAFNFLAKAPNVNQSELMKQLLPLMRLDPTQLLTQPPPKGPEPPKTSIIVKGEDLSPLAPQYANVQEVLKAEGLTLTPQPITPTMVDNQAQIQAAKAPVPHPGTPPLADKVNQHAADRSGETQNIGGMAKPH